MMVMLVSYLILRSHGGAPSVLTSIGKWLHASWRQPWLVGVPASESLVPPAAILLHQLLATTMSLATEVLRHG